MASKNSVKVYAENSFYHVYNRGVEKRKIFLDKQDFSVFLSYLQTYLTPKDEDSLTAVITSPISSSQEKDKALKLLRLKNYSDNLELLCHALLPNHFHLLLRQNKNVLPLFMNSLGTRYGMYFNRKYHRTGVLFQDVYKAVLIETNEQLLHLSGYIHLNPSNAYNLPPERWQEAHFPSSLPEYLGKRHTSWIKTHYVLEYFSKTNPNLSYAAFLGFEKDFSLISSLAIDLD